MPSKVSDKITELENYQRERYAPGNCEKVQLLDNGTKTEEQNEATRLDNFMRFPVLREYAKEELEKTLIVENAIEKLEDIKVTWKEKAKDLNSFCNALFLGILERPIGRIVYKKEKRTGIEEIVLANKTMDYPDTILYQAYVSYKVLDDNTREMIDNVTKNRINNLTEADGEIAMKLRDVYNPSKMTNVKNVAKEYNAYKEICNFYDKFIDLLWNFTGQFE